jgi:hypothetical protein
MTKPRICVFEDKTDNYTELEAVLKNYVEDDFAIERYDGTRGLEGTHDAEEWVKTFLLAPLPATLAVIDWDLGEFNHAAEQPFVRGVAEDLSIPVVMYQGERPKEVVLERLNRWQERRIALDAKTDTDELGCVCAEVARGFQLIWEKVSSLGDTPRLLETLKALLAPPDDTPLHLEEFAIGNQELLTIVEQDAGPEQQRFISTWMGYLIHNRILQFPGPILGWIAASAYLGIHPREFREKDLRELLADCSYKGPFAKMLGGWWRSRLDETIAAHSSKEDPTVPLGRVALGRALKRDLAPAQCRSKHDIAEPGFVCVLTGEPVCRQHSEAPEAWIPNGADRCRIHTDDLERMQGWLGL